MRLPRYEPMLATLWRRPFTDADWVFEEKVDGFRMLLYWDGRATELRSRSGRNVTELYPELATGTFARPCVIDGEAVVRDLDGIARFELMQQRTGLVTAAGRQAHPVEFVAFDVLFDGEEVIRLPLEERQARLDALAPHLGRPGVADDGFAMWDRVEALGLEGMVAKRRESRYSPGTRSEAWRKVPRVMAVRAVVGGFTAGEGGRAETFGSLQLGLWSEGALRWVGSVGTGFTDPMLEAIRAALDEQVVTNNPFHPDPEMPDGVVWVEPQLVAMVGIKEWTRSGRMRAPRFLGFTDDDPRSVTWESEHG